MKKAQIAGLGRDSKKAKLLGRGGSISSSGKRQSEKIESGGVPQLQRIIENEGQEDMDQQQQPQLLEGAEDLGMNLENNNVLLMQFDIDNEED